MSAVSVSVSALLATVLVSVSALSLSVSVRVFMSVMSEAVSNCVREIGVPISAAFVCCRCL